MKFIGSNEGRSENRTERMHSPTGSLSVQHFTTYGDQIKTYQIYLGTNLQYNVMNASILRDMIVEQFAETFASVPLIL